MKKTFLAITHAGKNEGVNPRLTDDGVREIHELAPKLIGRTVTNVILGTGTRFLHTFEALKEGVSGLEELPVKYSPFLGSADSGKKAETGFDVLLADGTPIHDSSYIGLIGTPGVDLWAFLAGIMKDGSLLVTGREFIGAFLDGGASKAKSATIYQFTIDDEAEVAVNNIVEIQ